KHLKRNLEATLEDLDKSEREIEELKEKVSDAQLVIKRLRKDLKGCSNSDLEEKVKKLNEENASLKEQLEEFDD
ncbi:hypothetical protein, partial [[Clostridium] innocuum]|uniref:hypothetical protein n=1 Tax=Clostridium innocuum TaxID=1522 RepID=UPI0005D2A676